MILKLPENRKKIVQYLNKVDEDTFIDDIVIPFFGSQGYQLYRINSHGPGEHGKDVIFCRYVPIFFDSEYIAVQAKAEKVNTSNVEKFSGQLTRALNTKFPSRSGSCDLYPHFVIFINAREHTNDANTEFPQLVKSQHVKILSQENVCDLIMQSGIAPEKLLDQLSLSVPEAQSKEDKKIFEIILGNNPSEIDDLLDHKLKFLKNEISPRTKELIIDYIFDRWDMDRSWAGTVKPMKWLNRYFEFITERQYKNLMDVIEELTSSTHSFEADSYTSSVASKMTVDMLASIAEPFILHCAKLALSRRIPNQQLVFNKLKELHESEIITDRKLNRNMKRIIGHYEGDYEGARLEAIEKELELFAFPKRIEVRERRKKRE